MTQTSTDPSAATRERATIHLVPHTHWDREWYRPFQSFRMQLVELVDRVLDMLDADPGFAFTLDGQLATVDDVLEIRPEHEDRIRRHVASGRLAIGPWLILMDEFLVGGETLVRNLEAGWRRGEELGGPMRVGYLPDMFGHVAQMPQILSRAGIDDAVVWRGVPAAIDRHAFRWEAPDGSAVRAEYLPAGYGNAAYLFAVPDALDASVDHFIRHMGRWFGDEPMLAMYGADHTAPVTEIAALVSRMNELGDAARIEIGTLAAYIGGAAAIGPHGPAWRGEMRSGARANVLMGVASARIDIKAACARAERELERYAEPFAALHLPAEAWPARYLELAWRRVIENSAHDSICGCSTDEVVRQVLVRFAEASQIATGLARRALVAASGGVPRGAWAVLNPSPEPRADLVELELAIPDAWEAVALELPDGTRLATQEVARNARFLHDDTLRGADADDLLRRMHGRELFDHALNGYRIDDADGPSPTLTVRVDRHPDPAWLDVEGLKLEMAEALRARPDATWRLRVEAGPRRRLLAAIPAPALGWTAARPVEAMGDERVADAVHPLDDGTGLANGRLAVRVADDGTLRLEASDGTVAAGVGRIVDGGDVGDSYNYGPPPDDRLVEAADAVEVEVVEDGPLRGRIVVRRRYAWPAAAEPDGGARSVAIEPTEVTTEIELRAGEPFVRLAVAFDNRSEDHRVRLHVPTPRAAEASHAEGQFAVVERGMRGEGGYREEPLATFPARGWVDAGGVALLLDHVAEYELLATEGGGRELAVTLLRSIGLISRNANPYRQDPAGPEIAVPEAQMRGRRRFTLALLPHADGWREAGVAGWAERYQHPFLGVEGAAPEASWPPARAGLPGLAVDGDDVVLSALRRREDGWVEARLVNLADAERSAAIGPGLREAREADLLGRPGDRLPLDDGRLRLDLGPAEIRTVQLRRDDSGLTAADVLDAAGPRG